MANTVESVVKARIAQARDQIIRSLRQAASGNPLGAETDRSRRRARLRRKAGLDASEADAISCRIEAEAEVADRDVDNNFADEALLSGAALRAATRPGYAGPEKIWGDTRDFVGVAFLEQGARAARSVGRITFGDDGQPLGSGFLIGSDLLLTNHHVVESATMAEELIVEFDYELDTAGAPRGVTQFTLDADVFVTDSVSGLDFTIVGVGRPLAGDAPLVSFGVTPLSAASDKHMLGEFANIVQHANGRYKEVVLRENRLVWRMGDALHYVADTQPGSSGSPVFNSQWRVIALHHWGGPWIEQVNRTGRPLDIKVNEGIRISSIVKTLRHRQEYMDPQTRRRVMAALDRGESRAVTTGVRSHTQPTGAPQIEADGRVSWTLPIEVSVRLPGLKVPTADTRVAGVVPAKPAAPVGPEARLNRDYSNRKGYKERFIRGHTVPLPRLGKAIQHLAARNKEPEVGEEDYVLPYHHFSIVMNRSRRLAFFAACNIDGKTAKSINRYTGAVTPLRADSGGLAEELEEAERSDTWYTEPRLDPSHYAGLAYYKDQNVPGYPNPRSNARIARMFQKGHLVRRIDPAWGSDEMVVRAEKDTFHWTNCAPQVGFFNQGNASASIPGSGRGNLWRSVENYVLRNAVAEDERVSCFTGPIFDDDTDQAYRGLKIPGHFFKIVVWSDGGSLRSLAMTADQTLVYDAWPEAIWNDDPDIASRPEAFQDDNELNKVRDFLSSIAEIEKLTDLDFGAEVRAADIRAGAEASLVVSADQMVLVPQEV